MNAERLHAICAAVKDAIESRKLLNELTGVATMLQNVVNQPQQPNHQQQLTQRLDVFYGALSDFPTDSFIQHGDKH